MTLHRKSVSAHSARIAAILLMMSTAIYVFAGRSKIQGKISSTLLPEIHQQKQTGCLDSIYR